MTQFVDWAPSVFLRRIFKRNLESRRTFAELSNFNIILTIIAC